MAIFQYVMIYINGPGLQLAGIRNCFLWRSYEQKVKVLDKIGWKPCDIDGYFKLEGKTSYLTHTQAEK